MAEVQTPQPIMTAVEPDEVRALLRRAAGARGIAWPDSPARVEDAGGLEAELAGGAGLERLVWGTLNGVDGLLALLRNGKLLGAADKGLGRITAVQPVSLPGLPHLAVLVDDHYDQSLGAYLTEDRRRIFVWDGRGLREVWQGLLSSEQIHHATWQNPRAPNVWRRQRVEGESTLKDGLLTERRRELRSEAVGSPKAPVPPPEAFRVVSEQTTERQFRWNPRLRRFDTLEGPGRP